VLRASHVWILTCQIHQVVIVFVFMFSYLCSLRNPTIVVARLSSSRIDKQSGLPNEKPASLKVVVTLAMVLR